MKVEAKVSGSSTFETHYQAEAAVDALHDSEYKGKKLFVAGLIKKSGSSRLFRTQLRRVTSILL